MRSDESPFTCQCEKEDKKLEGFHISHFYWSFLSENMAVKGCYLVGDSVGCVRGCVRACVHVCVLVWGVYMYLWMWVWMYPNDKSARSLITHCSSIHPAPQSTSQANKKFGEIGRVERQTGDRRQKQGVKDARELGLSICLRSSVARPTCRDPFTRPRRPVLPNTITYSIPYSS